MQQSHTPLSTWFWGAYLVTTQTPGMSAVQFQRQLGLRYETAFQILHKLRAGMVRPERDSIGAQYPVEVDETLVGGRSKGEGRGVHHKATVVGAIEVRPRALGVDGKKRKKALYAGRLRLRLVPNRSATALTGFVQENVVKGAVVRTDGWDGYDGLAKLGYAHEPMVLDGDGKKTDGHLPMIHIAFSNLKTWLLGTHHGVSQQHLQAYLNEFVFRFNRRFYPMTAFNSILGLAAHASAPNLRETLQRRVDSPDSMIGNKPDRQALNSWCGEGLEGSRLLNCPGLET
jgi:transposase-like protein